MMFRAAAGFVLALGLAGGAWAQSLPVKIGISAEFGVTGSTSAQAIRMGAAIAVDEINAAGGVLGGRRLELVEKDDRSVPARAIQNLRDLAADPAVVGVLGGKYSPPVVESLPEIHRLGIPFFDPWAAADSITEHDYRPDYVFRLSLRDSWAMQAMVDHARARGLKGIGILVPNTEWGRSSERALRNAIGDGQRVGVVSTQWYHWGEPSFQEHYAGILAAKAEGLILVGNEREGALLIREMAALPPERRLPVLSHWGITGGTFFQNTRDALPKVDLTLVQTYSFLGATDPVARRVVAAARRMGMKDERAIASPVGVAHAYDLVHIIARAVDAAGSTDRAAIRDALEKVTQYHGLVRTYARPFAPGRHDALSRAEVFMARYADDGTIERIAPVRK